MDDHFTPIFNEVLEALSKINLTSYETRVLMAIWRKTYGFIDRITGQRKKYDIIATSQLAIMCRLDKRHVSRALKGLKDKFVICRDDKKTGFSKQFMKLLSSVEMTNSKGVSPVEGIGIPCRDDKVSPVEAPQIERLTETIQKKVHDDKHREPLEDVKEWKRKPLEKQTVIQRIGYHYEDACKTKIVNWGKEAKAIKNMMSAGYTEDQIKKCITYMAEKHEFYKDKGFTLSTVTNEIVRLKAQERSFT